MTHIQALTPSELANFSLPDGPFRVGPSGYRVVDGDTIKIMSGRKSPLGEDIVALRLRFRSIAAPETRKTSWEDRSLAALGADPNRFCPGRRARDLLRQFTRRRDIVISHGGRFDPYGRLLADISVLPDRDASLKEAVSLERVMLAKGVVDRFGAERVPDLHPFGDNLLPAP
jgi:endonuclease YncB( thermonuclease family)